MIKCMNTQSRKFARGSLYGIIIFYGCFYLPFSGQNDDSISPKMGVASQSANGIQPSSASDKPPPLPLRNKIFSSKSSANKSKWRISLGSTSKYTKLLDQHDITSPVTSISEAKPSLVIPNYANIDTFSKSHLSRQSPKVNNETDSTLPTASAVVPNYANIDTFSKSRQSPKVNNKTDSSLPSASAVIPSYANIDTFSKSRQSPKVNNETFDFTPKHGIRLPPVPTAFVDDPVKLAVQQFDQPLIPLPPTPLDATVSNTNSKEGLKAAASLCPAEIKSDDDISEDKVVKKDSTDEKCTEGYSSSSDGYKRIDFRSHALDEKSSSTQEPSITNDVTMMVDDVTTTESNNKEDCMTNEEIRQADNDQNDGSLLPPSTKIEIVPTLDPDLGSYIFMHEAGLKTDSQAYEIMPTITTESLPNTDRRATVDNEPTTCMQKQQQTSSIICSTSKKLSNASEYLKLKCLDPDLGSYIFMHKAGTDSQAYAYDYIYHSYIKTYRCKLHQSGVPPRKVKREGYTPIVTAMAHVSYINIESLKLQTTPLLPPRNNNSKPHEQQSNLKLVMPPRNISRPGCYLSAPSAVAL